MQAIRHHGLLVPDSLSTDVDALQISCSRSMFLNSQAGLIMLALAIRLL